MGFFDGLGRFISGKPVFEDEGSQSNQPAATSAPDSTRTSVDARGYKIVPKFEVSQLRTTRDGDQMTSELWVQNQSDETIRIDSIGVADQRQVFNRELGPQAGHQFIIYRGPVQRDESRHKAKIVYRLVRSDDLFEEEYFVEFSREPDGAYLIEEFHLNGPTRDI